MIPSLLHHTLNFLLPPHCLACHTEVQTQGGLCTECWNRLQFLGKPACVICGQPFAYSIGESAQCATCIAKPPTFDRAVAVFRYDNASSNLITGFKYADKIHGAKHFAQWMVNAGRELLIQSDIIAPVPLHPKRLFARRYNQAALLAHHIASLSHLPYEPQLLQRTKDTPPQASLNQRQRQKNVKGAFQITKKHLTSIKGQHIMLIDDVATTGATIQACANVLKKAGAEKVFVITLAKTVIE